MSGMLAHRSRSADFAQNWHEGSDDVLVDQMGRQPYSSFDLKSQVLAISAARFRRVVESKWKRDIEIPPIPDHAVEIITQSTKIGYPRYLLQLFIVGILLFGIGVVYALLLLLFFRENSFEGVWVISGIGSVAVAVSLLKGQAIDEGWAHSEWP